MVAATCGLREYSQLKMRSSALNGVPSCQRTLRLRRHVTERPSSARVPRSTEGISAASTGTSEPSGAQPASGS